MAFPFGSYPFEGYQMQTSSAFRERHPCPPTAPLLLQHLRLRIWGNDGSSNLVVIDFSSCLPRLSKRRLVPST